MNTEAQKHNKIGNDAFKKEDFVTALKNYEKAIELEPNEITYKNKMAELFFEMKNFTETVKLCLKASKIGQEHKADPKNIANCFVLMGKAHKEFGNLKMAKLAFEKAQKENDTSDYEKYLSEIESEIEKKT